MGQGTEYWSTQKVANHCGVTRKTVTRWVDAGVLPAIYTTGGHRRIRAVDVRAFLKGRRSLHAGDADQTARDCVLISNDSNVKRAVKTAARDSKERLRVRTVSNGFEAGLVVGGTNPSLILVDESTDCDPAAVGRLLSSMVDKDTVVVACMDRPSHARRAHLAVNGVRTVLHKPLVAEALLAVFLEVGIATS